MPLTPFGLTIVIKLSKKGDLTASPVLQHNKNNAIKGQNIFIVKRNKAKELFIHSTIRSFISIGFVNLTRDTNIVADGWAGAYNFPHTRTHTLIHQLTNYKVVSPGIRIENRNRY